MRSRPVRRPPWAPLAAQARAGLKAALDYLQYAFRSNDEQILLAVGRSESRWVRSIDLANIQDAEFRIFSQWGEDGILQYLLSRVVLEDRTFVELGVGDYREANTRFLLQNDNWRGLVVDAGAGHLAFLERSGLRWRHAVDGRTAFVTVENVDQVISEAGFAGDIGLLSVDLDGNDYWVFQSIHVVSPRVLVLEYNSLFGADHAVTIPYDPAFVRHQAHYSGQYFGASLPALCRLTEQKGYRFVGSGSSGVNAFFVRATLASRLPDLTAEQGWVASQHRDSRDERGRLTYLGSREDRLRLIGDLPLYELETAATRTVAEIYGL